MKIGLLTTSLSRNAGGLYDATRMLARGLQNFGCAMEVFGLQDTNTERDSAGWAGLSVKAASMRGPSALGYGPALGGTLKQSTIDLLHTHGLWMYPSRASLAWAKSRNKPYVISPHGMLDPWAVNNSRWKDRK